MDYLGPSTTLVPSGRDVRVNSNTAPAQLSHSEWSITSYGWLGQGSGRHPSPRRRQDLKPAAREAIAQSMSTFVHPQQEEKPTCAPPSPRHTALIPVTYRARRGRGSACRQGPAKPPPPQGSAPSCTRSGEAPGGKSAVTQLFLSRHPQLLPPFARKPAQTAARGNLQPPAREMGTGASRRAQTVGPGRDKSCTARVHRGRVLPRHAHLPGDGVAGAIEVRVRLQKLQRTNGRGKGTSEPAHAPWHLRFCPTARVPAPLRVARPRIGGPRKPRAWQQNGNRQVPWPP